MIAMVVRVSDGAALVVKWCDGMEPINVQRACSKQRTNLDYSVSI